MLYHWNLANNKDSLIFSCVWKYFSEQTLKQMFMFIRYIIMTNNGQDVLIL